MRGLVETLLNAGAHPDGRVAIADNIDENNISKNKTAYDYVLEKGDEFISCFPSVVR